MKSKYINIAAICQVIGILYNKPTLFDNEEYTFNQEDFVDSFHQSVFAAMYNCYQLGVNDMSIAAINDYLKDRPKMEAAYKSQDGDKYLLTCAKEAEENAFDYYYNRMKKMTLFRAYESIGLDLTWLYNPDNILDINLKERQEDYIDSTSIVEIDERINKKIDEIKEKYASDSEKNGSLVSTGIDELIESLKENPDYGIPLYGDLINTVTRGARIGKFYLRSAPTGVGKSRMLIADACTIGCSHRYDKDINKWIDMGESFPVVYISTEQSLPEIQTMMLAFLSGVNEDHILSSTYIEGEIDRVRMAAKLLKDSKIMFYSLPDFSMKDVENTIKRGIRENNARYIMFDYLHTSMKILEEVSHRSGGVKLREDNVLFMLSIRLKDICVKQNVFIITSTQLNADYQTSSEPDQNLLRGAKSVADKIDLGMIALEVTEEDKEALQPVCNEYKIPMPDIKLSVYKNRSGAYKGILLWCKAERGICQITPYFVTNYRYEFVDIKGTKIKAKVKGAF